MKEKIIGLLKKDAPGFISGQKISDALGVSRTAIWKYINTLKEEGYVIESQSRKGYRLASTPDRLTAEEIKGYLKTEAVGRNIIHYETIGSTNKEAKERASGGEVHGTVVISEEQTTGRGRLGRTWVSPKGKGIWLSILLRPDIHPMEASKITQVGAAAVYKALTSIGVTTEIKWPNDIVLNGKKICGILTEMSGELNKVNYIVLGMGMNVNIEADAFPEEIRSVATSLLAETEQRVDRKVLVARILNEFEALYHEFIQKNSIEKAIEICKEASVLLGKEVKVISRHKEIRAMAVDINDEGELIIRHRDGQLEKVISGEVSVRGLYGYV